MTKKSIFFSLFVFSLTLHFASSVFADPITGNGSTTTTGHGTGR